MINKVRNSTTTMMVLMLALLAQVPHAQSVFYDAGTDKTWFGYAYSWLFAIALEVAVFFFVVHSRQVLSYVFAFASVCVNLSYYAIIPPHIAKWLVSIMLPLAIAFYSHLVVEDTHTAQSEIKALDYVRAKWCALWAWSMRIVGHTHSDNGAAHIDASEDAQTDDTPMTVGAHTETHSDDAQSGAGLDATDRRILDAVRSGAHTAYAISKTVEISASTLRRKDGDAYVGRLPRLVEAGYLRNGGSEYTVGDAQ